MIVAVAVAVFAAVVAAGCVVAAAVLAAAAVAGRVERAGVSRAWRRTQPARAAVAAEEAAIVRARYMTGTGCGQEGAS